MNNIGQLINCVADFLFLFLFVSDWQELPEVKVFLFIFLNNS